ncbi:hypothetical protein IJJ08_05070 [bacterium]|nr:hypothetical protein [bacterium]
MPVNTEYSLPETIAAGNAPDPVILPKSEAATVFFPRMKEKTFAQLKQIMGGVTRGRDTRGQEENQALIDTMRQSEGFLFDKSQTNEVDDLPPVQINPELEALFDQKLAALQAENPTDVLAGAVSETPKAPVNPAKTLSQVKNLMTMGLGELPVGGSSVVGEADMSTGTPLEAVKTPASGTLDQEQNLPNGLDDAPFNTLEATAPATSEPESSTPLEVSAIEPVNDTAQTVIESVPEIAVESVPAESSLTTPELNTNDTTSEQELAPAGRVSDGGVAVETNDSGAPGEASAESTDTSLETVTPEATGETTTRLPEQSQDEAGFEVNDTGIPVPTFAMETPTTPLETDSDSQVTVNAADNQEGLAAEVEHLTPEEASKLSPDQLNDRLSRLSQEERQNFLQSWADTEDIVKETVDGIQQYQSQLRVQEGGADTKPQIFEVDDEGKIVGEAQENAPVASEPPLPEPKLPEVKIDNSFEITENTDESVKNSGQITGESQGQVEENIDGWPKIYDLETESDQNTKKELIDQENSDNINQETESVPEENIADESLRGLETVDFTPVMTQQVEQIMDPQGEYLAGEAPVTDERLLAVEQFAADKHDGQTPDLPPGQVDSEFYASLEAVTSRRLSKHDTKIEWLQKRQAAEANADARVKAIADYGRLSKELTRQTEALLRLHDELQRVA